MLNPNLNHTKPNWEKNTEITPTLTHKTQLASVDIGKFMTAIDIHLYT